jgi:hypothetical protein
MRAFQDSLKDALNDSRWSGKREISDAYLAGVRNPKDCVRCKVGFRFSDTIVPKLLAT